jgi:hypothetical protein
MWAAAPGRSLFGALNGESCYYNLLVKGFRSGHLSLGVEPSPQLLRAKDPYDPAVAVPFGIPDVSFYKGKYYLYFGVAPALVLYWPFAAISGKYINDPQAVFLLCSAAFLVGSILLIDARRRYFPALGLPADIGVVLAVGLAAMIPVLLRRTQVYEVAISSAYLFFVLSLFGMYWSLHSPRNLRWLAFASLCYGLAIASRPTYLFGAAGLLVPVWFGGDGGTSGKADTGLLARACAAIIPVTLIVLGILVYNYLRFDSPIEFGQRLTLSGVREMGRTHFSLSYVWFNCRAYLFAPANLSPYFPFVRVVSLPAKPAGHLGVEDPYGIFPNMPFVLLALFAPLACKGRPGLGRFVLGAALASIAVACFVFSFEFASNRYMVDFLPGLMLVAVVGSWGLWSSGVVLSRRMAGAACAVLLAWTTLFNVFAAFGHNNLLRIGDPASYQPLAHAFGYPRKFLDSVRGRKYGPIELTVRLPKFEKAHLEPLVITGSEFLSDYLYLFYLPDNRLMIGFEHTNFGGPETKPFICDYAATHHIVVDMAPLYPPKGDPYFDNLAPSAIGPSVDRLRILVDGAVVMDEAQQFYPAFSPHPSIGGGTENQTALGRRFTGEIMGVRTLESAGVFPAEPSGAGPLVITLEFPKDRTSGHEPLVSSGNTGKGDVLVVNYIDSNHVTFALDHWGQGGPVSDPVEFIPGDVQILEVRFGSFFPTSMRPENVPVPLWTDASGKLLLKLNHRTVLERVTDFYEAKPETVVVGKNSIGASSCGPDFTGRIIGSQRRFLTAPE